MREYNVNESLAFNSYNKEVFLLPHFFKDGMFFLFNIIFIYIIRLYCKKYHISK